MYKCVTESKAINNVSQLIFMLGGKMSNFESFPFLGYLKRTRNILKGVEGV